MPEVEPRTYANPRRLPRRNHYEEGPGFLPVATRGSCGGGERRFDRYEPVRGTIPTRAGTDQNPLDRKEYLLHLLQRVSRDACPMIACSDAVKPRKPPVI